MYKKGRGLMKQLYEDQVLLFEDQDLIAEEYAEIQERKMILGEIENGYIDVGDGCWRPNMLVTSLRCW